jgi:hypothetical protein
LSQKIAIMRIAAKVLPVTLDISMDGKSRSSKSCQELNPNILYQ